MSKFVGKDFGKNFIANIAEANGLKVSNRLRDINFGDKGNKSFVSNLRYHVI